MSSPSAPFKTPTGVDELRSRSRGLGQRHRTVLFLVDGRRSVGEVLAMALAAGADTVHFEDLVRLGLVEIPLHAMAPEPQETAPGALDLPRLTSVELEVPPLADPVAAAMTDTPAPLWSDTLPSADRDPADEPPHAAEAAPPTAAVVTEVEMPPVVAEPQVPPSTPPPRASTPKARSRASAPAPSSAPVPAAASAPAAPSAAPSATPAPPARPTRRRPPPPPPSVPADQIADHARPRPAHSDALIQRQVRSLLLGAIGAEAALFAPLTLTRIRNAQDERDLIGLVWEIERQRSHLRRSRAQLLSLEKARELLGMGNTLVAGDSQHGAVWPDTRSQG